MKILAYLTTSEHACCNVSELLQLSKADKLNGTHDVDDLKRWAREEMINKGITIEE